MFKGASLFNGDMSNWEVVNVETMGVSTIVVYNLPHHFIYDLQMFVIV